MHPLLAKIGPVPIHTYGVMLALGFLGGLFINRWLAKKNGIDSDEMVDATFWGMLVGVLGARIVYILTLLPQFMHDPMGVFRVWEGGLVFWGGPIAVFLWAVWYLPRRGLDYWKFADVAIFGLVVGHILGRLGCLAAGCCYGKPTNSDWGIRLYTDLVDPAHRGVLLHPVQLYESSALCVLLVGMLWVFFKKKVFDGQVFLTYLICYPIIRSFTEIYRGDLIRGFVIDDWLSTSQFISALVLIAAGILLKLRLDATKVTAA